MFKIIKLVSATAVALAFTGAVASAQSGCTINNTGQGLLETITTRVTLSPGPVSILEAPEGTSLMVHAKEDPYSPGESGSGHSGGPRLACGKIEAA